MKGGTKRQDKKNSDEQERKPGSSRKKYYILYTRMLHIFNRGRNCRMYIHIYIYIFPWCLSDKGIKELARKKKKEKNIIIIK